MVAIVTLQEENEGGYVEPTASSVAFWSYLANHYKDNDDVFFDLYNEPDLPASAFGSSGSQSDVWNAVSYTHLPPPIVADPPPRWSAG